MDRYWRKSDSLSLNPVAAVAIAIYSAISIRFNELPITAEKVLFAPRAKEVGATAGAAAASARG